MGIKEEAVRFYDGLSDYNAKMFRTIRDLVVDPNEVIETSDEKYISAPRFAIIVLSACFAGMLYLNPPGAEGMSDETLLFYPSRVQEYLQLQSQLASNYSIFLALAVLVPCYFLFSRLLFWSKQSWIFFYRLSLYQVGLGLSGFFLFNGAIGQLLSLPTLYSQTINILLIGFFVYHFIRLKLGKWYWSGIKGAIIIFGTGFLSTLIGPQANRILENILEPQGIYYDMPASNSLLDYNTTIDGYDLSQFSSAEVFAPYESIILGEETIARTDSGRIVWEVPKTQAIDHVYGVSQSRTLVGMGWDENEKTLIVELRDMDGQQQYRQSFPLEMDLLYTSPVASSDSSFTLGLLGENNSQNLVTLVRFDQNDEGWAASSVSHSLDSDMTLNHIERLPGSGRYIATKEYMPEDRTSEMSVALLDSSFTELWSRQVYDKRTKYRPNSYVHIAIDESRETLFTLYTIANDSSMEARVHALDLEEGNVVWQTTNPIPSGFFLISEIELGKEQLYITGQARKYFSRHFWQPHYDISMIFAVDLQDGRMTGYKFFGPTTTGDDSNVESMWLEKDTLSFMTTEYQGVNLYDQFFERDRLSIKSIQVDKLVE